MNLNEAYLTLHKASEISAGDTVKIIRAPSKEDELGWQGNGCFSGAEDCWVNSVGKSALINVDAGQKGFHFSAIGEYWPFFCLELIKKGTPPIPPINIGDNVVEFTDKGIKVGCQEVSKEVIIEIYERLK